MSLDGKEIKKKHVGKILWKKFNPNKEPKTENQIRNDFDKYLNNISESSRLNGRKDKLNADWPALRRIISDFGVDPIILLELDDWVAGKRNDIHDYKKEKADNEVWRAVLDYYVTQDKELLKMSGDGGLIERVKEKAGVSDRTARKHINSISNSLADISTRLLPIDRTPGRRPKKKPAKK
ncbi:MAG: hypothetical protein ACON5C_09415 [Alphaproteobacteria bacterium]